MEIIFNEFNDSVEPKLCLNMIVKNESHIIKNTFDKLLQKVQFDYWIISDTGSTDNTKQVIINYFKEKNIKGELFDDEWKDFGHNRTKALEHAYGKSKYLFIFDADDEICGDFILPELTLDCYYLQFGDINGTSYVRAQIINNKKKWKYVGVLHEIITCTENTNGSDTIKGNYYTISGRTSSRNCDETKYLKDALILEKAYDEALKNKDEIYNRYGFYCANSYYDYGKYEQAIKWYKITLDNNNWSQEKYVSCLRLYNCYNALNQKETGFFYLVKSFSYDRERVECLCELIIYYCVNSMNDVAYGYYNVVKGFYNEKFLKYNLQDKLFLDVSKANFVLPYYMILISDKMQDFDTTIQMYKILFTKKYIETNNFFIGNVLYNLQFFIEKAKNDVEFINLFKEYIAFLISINYPVYDHDFMIKYEIYGIPKPKIVNPSFTQEECLKSNKILFYTGYSPFKWNDTFSLTNALGGSETAVINLSKKFSKNYKIYVAGNVKEETVDNIEYVDLNNLNNLINTTAFHTIIVSRYLNFYELYKNFSSYQTFIWGHDIVLFPYDTNLTVENILTKWSSKINGCVCQTEWHKNLFLSLYPELNGKIHIINNGINIDLFISKSKKINNRFIYTSCSERGLDRLLELWPIINANIPDAELFIASYNQFPNGEHERQLKTIIDKYPNIIHVGKLNKNKLYDLMKTSEYWLYPTSFNETSCITSMEMLMSEVICIYYPIAGLVNTIGDYGISVEKEQEVDTIVNLTNKKKNEIKKRGKEYAISCSWENRAKIWSDLIFKNNDLIKHFSPTEKRMFYLYDSYSIPEAHTKMLKTISESFTPKVIYDIGANTLHWTNEAKQIWTNAEFVAFDAIEEAEKLYKSKGLKYNIGVLSDHDNKIVKFYENKENPAGNTYYKEIGHPNSIYIFPEKSYSEKISMTLETIVKDNKFLLPDMVKIDVQWAELDILNGGINIINNAKYLIIELQNIDYNRGAPLENITIDFLNKNGWEIVQAGFSNNEPHADYLFINKNWKRANDYNNDYKIKIVNLERRKDRKEKMINALKKEGIDKYDFFQAIDGKELTSTYELFELFERNDFNSKRGVMGCALSHIYLWNELINDKNSDFYVILEDDIELCENFKQHLNYVCNLFSLNKLQHLALGEYHLTKPFPKHDSIIEIYPKDLYKEWNTTFAYIISKNAAKNVLEYINSCSIKCAIDNSHVFGNILNYSALNYKLVKCEIINENGSDIQKNNDVICYGFNTSITKKTLTVGFCDWWVNEYSGGSFDINNNYFVNLLINYSNNYTIKVVSPNESPDVLFYSIFGHSHKNYTSERKIFFSGEPYSQREEADFNITFDSNSYKNTRLPLWLCYFDNILIEDCHKRINNDITIPSKEKFCSFIAGGPGIENNRKTFIDKLSQYKKVDCGGNYLNNIGYEVPRGKNCSGKILHNNLYKFAMAFESTNYAGYVTEKICDIYKSKTVPIYWGTSDVVKDFNPSTFINANDFANFDELVEYIIKVDNDFELYASYFKEPMLSPQWINILSDCNSIFYKNLADKIIGKSNKLLDNYLNKFFNKTFYIDLWRNNTIDDNYSFPLSKYWFCNSELKLYILNNLNLEKIYNILEIGSFEGCSSCFFSDILLNNKNSSMICVDPFISDGCSFVNSNNLKSIFYSNIKKTKNNSKITVHEKYSNDFYDSYNGKKFNFIYIDGEHSDCQIQMDLEECFKLLEINGIMWCDDYNNNWKNTFINWIYQNEKFIRVIHDGYQLGIVKIKDYFCYEESINVNNTKTYSQASQDIFITNLLQHKKNGYFVEIGTNHPIVCNNTYLLEKEYKFKGLLVEYDKMFENSYKEHRPNSLYVIDDARQINYKKILDDNNFPQNIDYLQIDLDVDNKSTLDTLLLLNDTVFDSYKFATITFEHDYYRGDFFNTRQISREIFKNRGYLLVLPDVCTDQGCIGSGWQPFEDWYVHPELVNMELVNLIKSDTSTRHDFIKDNIIKNYSNYVTNVTTDKKMKIIFSNNCSVGDIYFSQPFIKNIVENNPDYDYYIYHQTTSYYFTDILNIKDVNKLPELKEELFQIFNFKIDIHNLININNMSTNKYRYDKTNNILLICTWVGCLRQEYNTIRECDMISYNETYKLLTNDINKDLNITLKYDDKISLEIYPSVPTLNINKFREFKNKNKNNDKKIIFYYNFLPSSGQPFPVNNNEEHNRIITNLAKDNIIVITNKNTFGINNNNVYFADDFLENVDYYDAKNFYHHAQMAYESDYSIYFDLGRGFMSMNKTFIEDNNKNVRLHLSNNEYFYNALNCNELVPDDYLKLVKVEHSYDIIYKLNEIIKNIIT